MEKKSKKPTSPNHSFCVSCYQLNLCRHLPMQENLCNFSFKLGALREYPKIFCSVLVDCTCCLCTSATKKCAMKQNQASEDYREFSTLPCYEKKSPDSLSQELTHIITNFAMQPSQIQNEKSHEQLVHELRNYLMHLGGGA